ncbi:MAG: cohesin domain-containing protein [bacterium]|nr:cohesin domain-containing protein [bacterium]
MRFILIPFGLVFIFSFPFFADAATLFISPGSTEAGVGDEIILDIKVDGEGVGFNAAQAVLRFPKETLEVVSLQKNNSAFSFWLEEPIFSNTEGIVSFVGGTPYGISGSSIQILKIIFKTKGSGRAELTLPDVAITAADGSGTNILSQVKEAIITVSPKRVSPVVVPELQQVTRIPTTAAALPAKPNVSVPLYPDESAWNNNVGDTIVLWEVGEDVVKVAVELNQNPKSEPRKILDQLVTGKNFGSLDNGIWYAHVQFKNNVGWGKITHYRIAIDTQPPVGFDVVAPNGISTDNPVPTLNFKTTDALSGLAEYQVRINANDMIRIPADAFDGVFKLPLQAPGKKQVTIRAVDRAGNSVENGLMLEVVPIDSPVITFITKELFSDEEKGLTARGTVLPGFAVMLSVRRDSALVTEAAVSPDELGNWETTFNEPLRNGRYTVIAQSKDERGALSLEVESPIIYVKSKPIIQIGPLMLGKGGALIFLLIVIAGGFGGGIWFYKKRQEKLGLRVSFSIMEIAKMFKLLQDNAEDLEKARATPTEVDDEFLMKTLKDNLKKMAEYIKRGVEKIKK